MSKVVDSRVVEMSFDNKNFEQNVKQSISTLDKLKKALDFANTVQEFSLLRQVSKNIDFSTLGKAVDGLGDKFTKIKEVGSKAFNAIKSEVDKLANSTISFLSNGIIQGGLSRAMKLENAHFQLQGLLKDEKQVAAIMDDVNKSVDGTAYGLDSAALAASQFAATGMRAGPQMLGALKAVAGTAAMTNSEYEDMSRIFTTVAGNGRLMGDQLLQLSSRGLNAAATIAEYLTKVGNGAKVTEAEVRKMVSDGKIDFETFAAAMDDAFGEHAAKANETFNGAMSNIRAALSRIGADFISPLIEQNGELVQLLNAIRVKVNEVRTVTKPFAESIVPKIKGLLVDVTKFVQNVDISGPVKIASNLWQSLVNVFGSLRYAAKEIGKDLKNLFPNGFVNILIQVSEKIESITRNSVAPVSTILNLWSALVSVFKSLGSVVKITGEAFKSVFPQSLTSVLVKVTGGIKDLAKYVEDLLNASKNSKVVNDLRDALSGVFAIVDILIRAVAALADLIGPWLIDRIKNIISIAGAIGRWAKNLDDAVKRTDAFNKAIESFRNFIAKAHDILDSFSNKVKEASRVISDFAEKVRVRLNLPTFKEALDSITNFAKSVKDTYKEWFDIATDTITKIVDKIHQKFKVADFPEFKELGENIQKAFLKPLDIIDAVKKAIKSVIDKVKDFLSQFELFNKIINSIDSAFSTLQEFPKNFKDAMTNSFEGIGRVLVNLADGFGDFLVAGVKNTTRFINTIFQSFNELDISSIGRVAASLLNGGLLLSFNKLLDTLTKTTKSASKGVDGLIGTLKGMFGSITGIFSQPNTILANINLVLNGAKDTFKSWQKELSAKALKEIALAVGILAGALVIIAGIDIDKLGPSLAAITGLFVDLMGSMVVFSKFMDTGIVDSVGFAIQITALSTSLVILASALKKISDLDPDKMAAGLIGIAGLLTETIVTMEIIGHSKNLDQKKVRSITDSMILLGAALEIFANVLKKLGSMDVETMAQSLIGLGFLLEELMFFSGILGQAKELDQKKFRSIVDSFVIFGVSLELFANVLKKLAALDPKGMAQSLVGLGVLLSELALFAEVVGQSKGLDQKKFRSVTDSFIIFGASLEIFINILNKIAAMDSEGAKQSLIGLGALMAELAIFTEIVGQSKGLDQKKFRSISDSFIILGASLEILADVLKRISALGPDGMRQSLIGLGLLFVELGIFAEIIGQSKGLDAKKVSATAASMLVISVSLEVLADVLNKLGKLSFDELGQGLLTIGAVLTEFAIALKFMDGTLKGSAAMLVAAVAIDALAPAMKTFGSMNWGSILKSLTMLAGTFAVLGAAGYFLAPFAGTIMMVAGAIGILCAGIAALNASTAALNLSQTLLAPFMSLANVLNASIAKEGILATMRQIPLVMTEFLAELATQVPQIIVLVLRNLSVMIREACGYIVDMAPVVIEALLTLVNETLDQLIAQGPSIMRKVLELVSIALDILLEYGPDLLNKLFDFLVMVLEGLTNRAGDLMKPLYNLFKSLFDSAVDAIKQLNVGELVETLASVGLIASIFLALGALVSLVPGALAGIAGISLVVAEISGIIALFGALDQIPGFTWLVSQGGELLQTIGEAIGKFVGGIIGGGMEAVSASLPAIGTNLTLFMNNLQGFIEGSKSIDQSSVNAVGSLVAVIMLITAESVIEAIASWITGGDAISKFAEKIVPFGEAMVAYSQTVSGKIDAPAVQASARAAEALAKLNDSLPRTGGRLQEWIGEKNLELFGQRLVEFGKAMIKYSDTITSGKGVDADAVENSVRAGSALNELNESLPRTGGKLQEWIGEKDLATFGQRLVIFGKSILQYSNTITEGKGINVDAIESSSRAGKMLSDLENTLPRSDGYLQKWIGEKNLGTFGQRLVEFGKAMIDYSNTVSSNGGIDAEAIEASIRAGRLLSDLEQALPDTGGILQRWFGSGSPSLTKFGEQIANFGLAIAKYSFSLMMYGGINSSAIASSVSSAQMLSKLSGSIPEDKGDKLSKFADNIAKFGPKYAAGVSEFVNINGSKLGSAIAQVNQLVNLAKNMSNVNASTISDFGNAFKELAKKGIEEFVKKFQNANDDAIKAVQSFIDSARKAASNKQNDINTTINTIIDTCIKQINNRNKDFENAGRDCIDYFNRGISNNKELPKNSTKTLLDDLLKAIRESLGLFVQSGENTIQQFTKGMNNKSSEPVNAMDSISNSTVSKADSYQSKFTFTGSNYITNLTSGMESKKINATKASDSIGSGVVAAANAYQSSMQTVGSNLGGNLVNGLNSKQSAAKGAGDSLGSSANQGVSGYVNVIFNTGATTGANYGQGLINGLNSKKAAIQQVAGGIGALVDVATRAAMLIKSPSRLAMETGGYYTEGLGIGMLKRMSVVIDAADTIADETTNSLDDALSRVINSLDWSEDFSPVITPTVNLDNVLASADEIASLFNGNRSLRVATSVVRGRESSLQNEVELGSSTSTNTTYQFTQNNYSPKELSRLEIYRQTRNQFAAFKEATSSV